MKNKILLVFFAVHFIFIFSYSISLIFSDYIELKNIKSNTVDEINYITTKIFSNDITDFYKRYTGLNTGYGFYGINVSTESYYRTEIYSNSKLLYTTTSNNLKSKNSLTRFLTIASSEMNTLSRVKDFEKIKDTIKNETKKLDIENKKKFTTKVLKYIGLYNYNAFNRSNSDSTNKCTHYVVTHYCLIPSNIWNKEDSNLKKYKLNEEIYYIKN